MASATASGEWCSGALAAQVWQRSPALAWLLDVPPTALLRATMDAPWLDDRMARARQRYSEMERQDGKRSA